MRELKEISEALQFTHERYADSLLKLPRAEDYEPLAGPLREFARVSPVLAESLADVLRIAAPLQETVRGLRGIAEALRSTQAALVESLVSTRTPIDAPAGMASPPPADLALRVLPEVAAHMETALSGILEALSTLPRDPDYARLAAQLRELATVSPSLLDWLGQVSAITMPLGDSVQSLRDAASSLAAGHQKLLDLMANLKHPRR